MIFWIKSGWIQSERVLRFYPCHLRKTLALFRMQSRLFATRSYEIRYGRPFSANGACKSSLFVCLFVYLFILGRKLNRQNCLLKEVLREREEKEEKEKKKSN